MKKNFKQTLKKLLLLAIAISGYLKGGFTGGIILGSALSLMIVYMAGSLLYGRAIKRMKDTRLDNTYKGFYNSDSE